MTQSLSPEQVREVTKAVLERPEFNPGESLTDWLGRSFGWLLEALPSWSAENPAAARVVVIALTVLLVGLLAHIGYVVIREFSGFRSPAPRSRARAPSLEPLEEIAENWNDAVGMARVALEAGNLHRALWIAHRLLLSALDRMDVVRFQRWKTNSDYLKECVDEGAAGALLSDLTAAYERVIYAHADFEHARVVRLLHQVEDLAEKSGV